MLQAKSPIVEELQDHMTGLQQHRGQVAADHSTGNDREEMAPAEAAVQAALGVLSRYTPAADNSQSIPPECLSQLAGICMLVSSLS